MPLVIAPTLEECLASDAYAAIRQSVTRIMCTADLKTDSFDQMYRTVYTAMLRGGMKQHMPHLIAAALVHARRGLQGKLGDMPGLAVPINDARRCLRTQMLKSVFLYYTGVAASSKMPSVDQLVRDCLGAEWVSADAAQAPHPPAAHALVAEASPGGFGYESE